MMVFEAEARRWGSQLMRTRLVWWLVLACIVVPVAGALLVAHFMGPPPLVNFAVWYAVIPFGPFLWIYVGLQLAAGDEPIEAGALKRAWSMSRLGLWGVQAALTGLLGVAGALVSTVVLTASIPAWHAGPLGGVLGHGLAAGLVFGSTGVLMLAWGMAWRALVPGVWSGIAGFALPFIGLVGNFVLGEIQRTVQSVTPVIWTSLLASDPWGYFTGKGTDVWGFGPYAAGAHRVVLLMLTEMVLALGLVLWKQLGASPRVRTGLMGTLLVVGALWWGVMGPIAALSRGNPQPSAPASLVNQGLRQELVKLTVGFRWGIQVTATVWPRSSGITALWLNPHITVSRVTIAGRPVVVRRTSGGWLYFARTRAAMTVQYQGDPLRVIGSGFPVVGSFANGTGVLLTGGGWYPLVGQQVARPDRPPIARYGLQVTNRGPGRVLTNVGEPNSQTTYWRTTTGLEVLAGRFTPVALPGMTLWSGSTASSVWGTDEWSPGANVATYVGHVYMSAGRPNLRYEARFLANGLRAPVVSLPWSTAVGPRLMALGNPNVVRQATTVNAEGPGTLGLLESLGTTYQNLGSGLNLAEFTGLWSHWSPAWLMTAGPWTTLPAYQRPAQAVVLTVQNWLAFPEWQPPFSWGKFGMQHIPAWFQPFARVPAAQRHRVWQRFLILVRDGQWPTWTAVQRFSRWAVTRP